jgi:hypothetical protein
VNNKLFYLFFFIFSTFCFGSSDKSLEIKLKKYQKKKQELEDKLKATLDKERQYIIKAYDSVIVSYTKKGDLENANKFNAAKKSFMESGDADLSNDDKEGESASGDREYPHEIKTSVTREHKFKNGDSIVIKKILGSESIFKVGAKYKIIGVYNLHSNVSGKLFLGIQAKKGSAKAKGDAHNIHIEKGENEFIVYREFNASGLMHLSMYTENGRVGRIKITSK